MKRRIILLGILIVLLVISTVWMLFIKKILYEPKPNMGDSMFIPAFVEVVPTEEDIMVPVYAIFPYRPDEMSQISELSLNDINNGWITDYYDGNCRLIFNMNDSVIANQIDMGDLSQHQYFYADYVPRERLVLENKWDMLTENKTDPFEVADKPHYYPDSIQGGIYNYYHFKPSNLTRNWLIRNAVIVLVVVATDLAISLHHRRKTV